MGDPGTAIGPASTPRSTARPVTPVGILAAMLGRVAHGLGGATDVDPDVWTELRAARALADGLEPYLSRCTTPESAALRDLAQRTCEQDWSRHGGESGTVLEQEMLSGHVEGQLLRMLVHLTRATRVLDVGMFTGYSALAMAEALPAGGQVIACEIDAGVATFAQTCFDETPDGGKIAIRVGPALDTLAQLSGEGVSFDLVFLDADKGGYLDYLTAVLDTGLLAPRGLVCADNTLLQGAPYTNQTTDPGTTANGEAIARFNDAVAADPRVEQVLVPLRDGLTLIRRTDAETHA